MVTRAFVQVMESLVPLHSKWFARMKLAVDCDHLVYRVQLFDLDTKDRINDKVRKFASKLEVKFFICFNLFSATKSFNHKTVNVF